MISIIVAMDKNCAIGKKNTLPWRLSADLINFKKLTVGHPIIMGRKTLESIGRPLPKRMNIIVTRNLDWLAEEIFGVQGLEEAISLAKKSDGSDEIFIIGGGEIYRQTIENNLADRLYVTEVDAEIFEADIFFPEIDKQIWKEVARESFSSDAKNEYGYSFVIYDKR